MHSDIILIGPMRVGKTTLGKLIAAKLGLPQVSLDDLCGEYFQEVGFSHEQVRRVHEAEGALGVCRYLWPFFPHAVERLLEEHHDCVIDLGAGHSVYEDEAAFARIQQLLAPYENVVLVLPSADLDTSAEILRDRTADVEWLQEIREQHAFDMNERFLRHSSNYQLAKIVVYTEGLSPEETRDEILRRVNRMPPPET